VRTHPTEPTRGGTAAAVGARRVRLSRQHRVVKALAVAGGSTLIALVFHLLAGGTMPGLLGIVVPFVFSVLVCVPLSGRMLSLPSLFASVVVSQQLFHWLFVLGAGGSAPATTAVDAHAHHAVDGMVMPAVSTVVVPTGASMWLAHAAAALLTVLFIRRGEQALIGVLDAARLIAQALLVRLPEALPVPAPTPVLATVFADRFVPSRLLRDAAISRRGPPRLLAAVS